MSDKENWTVMQINPGMPRWIIMKLTCQKSVGEYKQIFEALGRLIIDNSDSYGDLQSCGGRTLTVAHNSWIAGGGGEAVGRQ